MARAPPILKNIKRFLRRCQVGIVLTAHLSTGDPALAILESLSVLGSGSWSDASFNTYNFPAGRLLAQATAVALARGSVERPRRHVWNRRPRRSYRHRRQRRW